MDMRYLAMMVLALVATAAQAATLVLPDANVGVNPNYGGTTTVITFYTKDLQGHILTAKTYRGANQYVYVSECIKPDSLRYHCDIRTETGVVLTAPDGTQVVTSLTVQFAATLSTSGHNQWLQNAILLAGEVTTP